MDPSRIANIAQPHEKAEPIVNPQSPTINVCDYTQSNCSTFEKIDSLIIKMVNRHYYDLQMYANFVFAIDSDKTKLDPAHNFSTQVSRVQADRSDANRGPLFPPKQMEALHKLTQQMLHKLRSNWITAAQYVSELESMTFFAAGAASPTILVKADRKAAKGLMPIIIKIVPLEFPHHIEHLALTNPKQLDAFVQTYINAPSYALFLKEAWMYCFSRTRLSHYVPTFTCIANCYLVKGLPISNVQGLTDSFKTFAQERVVRGVQVPYKKWFDILTKSKDEAQVQGILNAKYGVFEMGQIEGTWKDMWTELGSFNLGMIFEYLYTKLVAAFVGRIIFTDDHLDNVGYVTVNHARAYHIKCNGCIYHFYIRSKRLVQFIDLERYVFNFSPYDIYTNAPLKHISASEYKSGKDIDTLRDSYKSNKYIMDKSIHSLRSHDMNATKFDDGTEYLIMRRLLASVFTYDIRTFCQIMDANLPSQYLTKPIDMPVTDYHLDLDDSKLRVIDMRSVYKNI